MNQLKSRGNKSKAIQSIKRILKFVEQLASSDTLNKDTEYYQKRFAREKSPRLKPSTDGPTPSRMHSQRTSTGIPVTQLPPVKECTTPRRWGKGTEPLVPPDAKDSEQKEEPENNGDSTEVKPKGTFQTKSFSLRKAKKVRKYKYKLCGDVVDSSHINGTPPAVTWYPLLWYLQPRLQQPKFTGMA